MEKRYLIPNDHIFLHEAKAGDKFLKLFCIPKDAARDYVRNRDNLVNIGNDNSMVRQIIATARSTVVLVYTCQLGNLAEQKTSLLHELEVLENLQPHIGDQSNFSLFPVLIEPPRQWDNFDLFKVKPITSGISLENVYQAAKKHEFPVPEILAFWLSHQMFAAMKFLVQRGIKHNNITRKCMVLQYPGVHTRTIFSQLGFAGLHDKAVFPDLVITDFESATTGNFTPVIDEFNTWTKFEPLRIVGGQSVGGSTFESTEIGDSKMAALAMIETVRAGWNAPPEDFIWDENEELPEDFKKKGISEISQSAFCNSINHNHEHTYEWIALMKSLGSAAGGHPFSLMGANVQQTLIHILRILGQDDWRNVWHAIDARLEKLMNHAQDERLAEENELKQSGAAPHTMSNNLLDESIETLTNTALNDPSFWDSSGENTRTVVVNVFTPAQGS
ncbi:hypothetical protein BS50DRAFT_636824 [Corynespora cassiicola Philippines]|uniref:Protein kinase domain-containing protein n=1 Tax=Corynespora cassiicola Philippines TaxID=1448308 RepID=A0A2T2NGW7_CORCC|nr:hypothetical protein BS50DRAFT_636824 [Corynespora cassiicola Philippines]